MCSRRFLTWLAIVLVLVSFSKGDFDQDKQRCGETLIGLSVCLPYVSGQAKAPTPACCTALKPVVEKSHVCLCILVKDRNDPGLNLNLKINATLALGLPDVCHTPSNATECPKLMNLPPNSPDAKVFEDFGKSNYTASLGNASNGKTGSSGDVKSDGGIGKNWLGVDIIWSLYIIVMFLFQVA